jgi:hypothetical protein
MYDKPDRTHGMMKMLDGKRRLRSSTSDVERVVMRKCAACGAEKPVKEMKTCMQNQMHRYVCDSKCMVEFYT